MMAAVVRRTGHVVYAAVVTEAAVTDFADVTSEAEFAAVLKAKVPGS
jgi:hypothetical protein